MQAYERQFAVEGGGEVLKDQRTLLVAFDRRWAVDRDEEAKTKETKEGEATEQGDVTLADVS